MPTMTRTCIAPHCDRDDIRARGMCGLHYQRWGRGNPMSFPIPDTRDDPEAPHWCVCEHPDQRPVTMFGWLELDDVTECSHCHRPPVTN